MGLWGGFVGVGLSGVLSGGFEWGFGGVGGGGSENPFYCDNSGVKFRSIFHSLALYSYRPLKGKCLYKTAKVEMG